MTPHTTPVDTAAQLPKEVEEVNYATYHKRVNKKLGKARECIHCHTKNAKRYEWANVSGKFGDENDYIQLCTRCHRKFDYGKPDAFTIETCIRCNKKFKKMKARPRQVMCGDRRTKIGCAYEHALEYQRKVYHAKANI